MLAEIKRIYPLQFYFKNNLVDYMVIIFDKSP